MAIYVIGDIQGCFDELLKLLELVSYDSEHDRLWFTGDLVNRGPKSLEVLRFVSKLPGVITVLGNHDLMLLALAYTDLSVKEHTVSEILSAPDKEVLLTWLRHQPLLFEDQNYPYLLVHAGIYPKWTFEEARKYAKEVEQYLQGSNYVAFLTHMFGNLPSSWNPQLKSWDRLRFIVNALTRMRFCDKEGHLDLAHKGKTQLSPSLIPWYQLRKTTPQDKKILFGHWAALEGKVDDPHFEALDTGCYWGGALTALRLEDGKRFSLSCSKLD